jgi:uncharacterized protein DUF5642
VLRGFRTAPLWYQRDVRVFGSSGAALTCAVALGVAACGGPQQPASTPATSTSASTVLNPARIDRTRQDLPPGYEVAPLAVASTPASLWGFGAARTADPPQCATLADPGVDLSTMRGWSGSGPGGIVYAAVAAGAPLDSSLADECGQWTLAGGHTTGTVTLSAGPAVPDAATTGMATSALTVVEGGTETHSHAETFVAYPAGYVVFVTVVTDPGSPAPPLDPAFGSELLVKTVSALRG